MKNIGKSDLIVSDIGMGCWPIGGLFYIGDTPDGYGEVDDQESIKAIRTAFEYGINLFDTADVYGAGHSEIILGRALKEIRQQAVIATKFGYGFNETTKTLIGEIYGPGYIERALEASLKRLGTDYIDIYQLHVGSIPEDAVENVFSSLEKQVNKGKIRAFGWSSDLPDAAKLLTQFPHAVSIQYECNILNNNPEMIELAKKLNLTAFCRSPLGMGLLSGKYDKDRQYRLADWDVRSQTYNWCKYFSNGRANDIMLDKLSALREVLMQDGRSLVQGALAWLWARSPNHIPIPGFRNAEQVKENCTAIEKSPLTQAQMQEIDRLLD